MGAIPEADPDEPVETKPFKFVTGKWANEAEADHLAQLLTIS